MTYILPILLVLILLLAFVKKVGVFDVFVQGATEGVQTILRLIPSLVGLITAIGVLRASGALDLAGELLRRPLAYIGMPEELLPLAIVRPVSGSAALAVVRDILVKCGVDSYTGRVACVMMGSSETILYTMTVYTQGTAIKRLPKVLPAALAAHIAACIFALVLCRVL